MRQLPLGVRLSDRARLSSYVPGANVEALAALGALIAPGGAGTLWLWGPAGSGRSHLLQAACAAVNGAGYFPLEELAALGPESLAGAAGLGLVAIDDVERVAGDADWERGLLFLYRGDRSGGRASADRRGIGPAPCRVRAAGSRLAVHRDDGARVAAAGRCGATRGAAAARRVRGLELPEETATYLQRRHPRDMPTLLALLERLDVEALSAQRRLTIPFIRQALDPASDAAPASPRGAPGPARG